MSTATKGINIHFHQFGFGECVAAISIKHYSWPHDIDDTLKEIERIMRWSEGEAAEIIDRQCTEQFRDDAERFARKAGFGGIEIDGRSGGWIVPTIGGHRFGEDDMRSDRQGRIAYARLEIEIKEMLGDVNDTRREMARDLREEASNYDGC